MTISKALELLKALLPSLDSYRYPDTPDAVKLGIAALKLHQDQTRHLRSGHPFSLPGETPEDTGDTSFRHDGHAHHSRKSIS